MIDLSELKAARAATKAHADAGWKANHDAMCTEFDLTFPQWKSETDPALKAALRKRLDELTALGEVSSVERHAVLAVENAAYAAVTAQMVDEDESPIVARLKGKPAAELSEKDIADWQEHSRKITQSIEQSLAENLSAVDKQAHERAQD